MTEKIISTHGVRHVVSPDYDWSVVYVNNEKVWEGHNCDGDPLEPVAEALGGTYKRYEFTDEDEIDGCTPDKFSDIIGLKESERFQRPYLQGFLLTALSIVVEVGRSGLWVLGEMESQLALNQLVKGSNPLGPTKCNKTPAGLRFLPSKLNNLGGWVPPIQQF